MALLHASLAPGRRRVPRRSRAPARLLASLAAAAAVAGAAIALLSPAAPAGPLAGPSAGFVGGWARPGRGRGSADAGPNRVLGRQRGVGVAALPDSLSPLSEYIVVKPKETAGATDSGILLSASRAERPLEGEVVATGPGAVDPDTGARIPVWSEVGRNVVYGKYAAEKVKFDGDDYVLLRDRSVLLSYDGDEASLDAVRVPLGKLLVRLRRKTGETVGGILLSKAAQKADTDTGDVVAVGEGLPGKDGRIEPMDIAVGDVVRFRYGDEVSLSFGADEFRVIDYEDCLAKWKE